MGRHGVLGIFGEQTVDVEHNHSALSWVVKATDGRVLLQVPWYWAFDQTHLGKRVYNRRHFLTEDEYVAHASRWEAFEVCMCACPLTSVEKGLLEQARPGFTSRAQYVVANPIWRPDPVRPARPTRPVRDPTPVPVPTRADVVEEPQPIAVKEPETAHEAGERKLLL